MAMVQLSEYRWIGLNADTRPSTAIIGAELRLYDTGGLEVFDGVDWRNVAVTSGVTQAVYASDHGVSASKTADENDIAIAAAVDATPAGGRLIFPAGAIHANEIVLSRSISVVGQGIPGTIFIPEDDDPIGFLKINVAGVSQIHNLLLRDFGVFPQTDRTQGAAVRAGYVGSLLMQNVKIGNSLGGRPYEGLRFDRVSDSSLSAVSISGCESHNAVIESGGAGQVNVEIVISGDCRFNSSHSGHGLLLKNSYGSAASTEGFHNLPGCSFYNNALDGIHIQCDTGATMQTIHLEEAILDTNGRNGLGMSGTAAAGSLKYLLVKNCWASNNGEVGVLLTAIAKDVRIDNGFAILNGHEGIFATGVGRLRLFGVDAHDNSQTLTQTYYGMKFVTCDNLRVMGGGAYNTGNVTPKQHGILYDTCTDTREIAVDLNVLSGQTAYTLTNITGGEVQRALWSEGDTDSFMKSMGQFILSGTLANEQIQWVSSANQGNKVIWRINGTTLERLNSAGAAVINTWDDSGNFDVKGAYIQFTEMVAPSAGAANTGRLFSRDNGAGKTQLCVIFPTGAIQVLATEP